MVFEKLMDLYFNLNTLPNFLGVVSTCSKSFNPLKFINVLSTLSPFLSPTADVKDKDNYLEIPIRYASEGLKANAYYFNNSKWAEECLTNCYRSDAFINRGKCVIGNWTEKVVVDIGLSTG